MANSFEHPSGAHAVLVASMSRMGYQLDTPSADSGQHAVPLLLLSDAAATRARPLQHLRYCALLYPVLVNGSPLLARVNGREGDFGFGGVDRGRLPGLMLESLSFAAQRVGHHQRLYETAFITSTSLQILLLVLKPASGRTLFLTLQDRVWTDPSDFRLEPGLARFLASTYAKRFPSDGHRA